MLVRIIERVLQQSDVRALHGPEDGFELGISQTLPPGPNSGGVDAPPAHVHHADEAHTRVRLEAVGSEAVVDGLEQAKVAGQADARNGVALGAQVEDVDGGGEQERELEGGADGREAVSRRVVGWEDGDVERIVLFTAVSGSIFSISQGSKGLNRSHIATYDA